MRLVVALLAAAIAAGAMASPALAAPSKAKVRKVIEAAGLMGWSAQDCSRPAGADNAWEQFYVDEEGYVIDADYEGTDGSPMYVVDAKGRSNGDIWIRLEVSLGEPEMDMTLRMDGARHRVWTLRNEPGTTVIQEGQWVQETGQSQWYTRCPGPMPQPPVP